MPHSVHTSLISIHLDLIKEEESRSKTVIPDEQFVAEYYEYRQQLDQMAADFREVVTHPTYALPFLQPGRLVKVKYEKLDFGWGVIINYQKRLPPKVCCHTPLESLD
jgi:ATP-dependent RNA helicase DOB1